MELDLKNRWNYTPVKLTFSSQDPDKDIAQKDILCNKSTIKYSVEFKHLNSDH